MRFDEIKQLISINNGYFNAPGYRSIRQLAYQRKYTKIGGLFVVFFLKAEREKQVETHV